MRNSQDLKKFLYAARSLVLRNHWRNISRGSTLSSDLKLPLCAPTLDKKYAERVAFTDYHGNNFTYQDLGRKILTVSKELNKVLNEKSRVSFLCPHDSTFPITLFGAWVAGHAGVPLSDKHPDNLLEYFVKASQSKVIVTVPEFADRLNAVAKNVGSELVVLDFEKLAADNLESAKDYLNPSLYNNGDALILFTSGTTGLPKGVLLTHNNLEAQVTNITDAWEITSKDTLLHTLPLHHTHGLIHALLSPMSVGGRVHMMQKFDGPRLWSELLSTEINRPNVLMGVPTVYSKLVEEYDKTFAGGPRSKIEFIKATCMQKMRLMLSGSAALPIPVLEKWEQITGHRLLERYGMTEIGMALTNPYRGERKPGFVGNPFQSVRLRVVDLKSRSDYEVIADGSFNKTEVFVDKKEKVVGDLLVKGPSVFKCYFNNPEATKKEFTEDGWFITGDTVEYVDGAYKILGRKSVDIIKSGGYKLSALEIETQLLGLKEVRDVSVMALPDPTWGQKVAAVIVWADKELSITEFRDVAKTRLASYAVPSAIKTVEELPRNHLGKVNKKELVKIFN
ncbi:unnamed protein product [Allacma fusca]|uniref:Uncharacterized protein n=1 Tax=Allacma fusca TaxID=39272 RepID=A0A8J2KP17_9HEXA|nr:unnamed protein product [Allacma fusca]